MILVALLVLGAAPRSPTAAADSGIAVVERQLSPKEAARDLRILKQAFTALHPGLFRYQSPEGFEQAFAQAAIEVNAGVSVRRFYALVAKLAADVHCGHTWTNRVNQPAAITAELFEAKLLLPALLDFVDGHFLVMAAMDPALQPGDEVLALGGQPMSELVRALDPMLRSDGANRAKHRVQLSHRTSASALDDLLPIVAGLTAPATYRLRVAHIDAAGTRIEREVTVAAVTLADRQEKLLQPPPRPGWKLTIEGDRAVWVMPTFSFYEAAQRAQVMAEFDAGLLQLKAQKVALLIVDLRENEGGSDVLMDYVFRGLIRVPFSTRSNHGESAYERAPYALVRFLDTWDFGFFDRTGDVVKGKSRTFRMKSRAAKAQHFLPAKDAFVGTVSVLIGPENSSASFLLAQRLQQAKAATLVGEPTGGNLRGLNGGELTWLTLPGSGVSVDIPLIAWSSDTPRPDRGVLPDVPAPRTLEDARAGRDTAMRAAMLRTP